MSYYVVVMLFVSSVIILIVIFMIQVFIYDFNEKIFIIFVYIVVFIMCCVCCKCYCWMGLWCYQMFEKILLEDDGRDLVVVGEVIDEDDDDEDDIEKYRFGVLWLVVGKMLDKIFFLLFVFGIFVVLGYFVGSCWIFFIVFQWCFFECLMML